MEITTSSIYILTWIRPNKNQIWWCKYAKVWSLSERCDRVTYSRAPLDSTVIYPKPGLPTNMRLAKGKTYQYYTFSLSNPFELDVDDLVLLKIDTFLDSSSSIHDHRGWQASNMRASIDGAFWACTTYLILISSSLKPTQSPSDANGQILQV